MIAIEGEAPEYPNSNCPSIDNNIGCPRLQQESLSSDKTPLPTIRWLARTLFLGICDFLKGLVEAHASIQSACKTARCRREYPRRCRARGESLREIADAKKRPSAPARHIRRGSGGNFGERMNAPDMDLVLALAGLGDVVGGLHSQQRVHLHSKGFFTCQYDNAGGIEKFRAFG